MPRALLSVYNKTGIEELARGLVASGWSIISSGGTAKALVAAGISVTDVADLTGVPAILDHRVVTLHPKVHGGILADTALPHHVSDMAEYGIEAIDLVVVNLYPFADNPSVDLIDVGGPAMIRAAAKNFARVGVVVEPSQYTPVLAEISANGALSLETRRQLSARAFATTRNYDAAIEQWMSGNEKFALSLQLEHVSDLRYGENPHQTGTLYRLEGSHSWWNTAEQLGGKEMSYLNVFDADAAWKLVHQFSEAAAVVVKHANPCGVATGLSLLNAYQRAHACDPVSAVSYTHLTLPTKA